PDATQNWGRHALEGWRRRSQRKGVALVEDILTGEIDRKPPANLSAGKQIHHVVAWQNQRIKIIVILPAGVPSLHGKHNAMWIPISRFPRELVLGDLRHVLANQRGR